VKRTVHSATEDLDWTVDRVWAPEALRQVRVGLPVDQIYLIAVIPALALVLPLRYAGVMSWRVEAVAFPNGRRGLPLVMAWRVKGPPQGTAKSRR